MLTFYFIGQERVLADYANKKPVSKQRISEVNRISITCSHIVWDAKYVKFNFNYVYVDVFNGSIPKVYFS